MPEPRIVAILMIVFGALGLAYGGFGYTQETHIAVPGPIYLSLPERDHFNVPFWAGASALLMGGTLLLIRGRG